MKSDLTSLLLGSLLLLAIGLNLQAGPRSSASYTIATDIADAGGKRTTSAAYTNYASAGRVTGVAAVASPAETAKHGYLGQLFDVTGLTLNAASPIVNEGATDQLAAWQALDDGSFLAVPAATVAWSVASGPLTGINSTGLATAGIVFQDTAASAQGTFSGRTAMLGLTVKNVNFDDFGSYAGDGIDDDWQYQYFGLNNPLAGPAADPDVDGQTNLFEFTAGLIPTDPQSRFLLTIARVAGQPAQCALIFTPLVAGRSYTVRFKNNLIDLTWQTLTGTTQSDNGSTRTVTDTTATGVRKFYQVQITKP